MPTIKHFLLKALASSSMPKRSEPSSKVYLMQPRSCSRAMKAVGVMKASCEEIFELVMSMDGTRYEWDCSLLYRSLVEEIHVGKHLMDLVAVDWFKDTKRMDHVARRQGCAAQVAFEKGLFSLIFNLQVSLFNFRSDDEFRNSRLKLIPSVPKANTTDELPERLIGAVRVSYIELKSAIVPKLEPETS
ncbi:hypothetical protein KPL71_014893 [Citrus sinensis]|uniref:Uncharacterized protein n=1 Tax=Citrus sinensis TaxID=2711 RepID=A0ACB8KF02_CITSI|nr:hypothetical protein KPL71_014893 [Citrus sinensis]